MESCGAPMSRSFRPAGSLADATDPVALTPADTGRTDTGVRVAALAPGNVLAGPDSERSMALCDDPTHHWVRDAWAAMPADPRRPMTDARGPLAAAT